MGELVVGLGFGLGTVAELETMDVGTGDQVRVYRIDLGEGKFLQQKVHGIFTYEVNSEGKLLALRGYWETEDARNQLVEVDSNVGGQKAG